MSVLETIRKRAGIFVVIAIGASMVVFILEDALTSGRFFFSGNENVVASANGKKVDYQQLNTKVEELENIEKESKGVDALDEQSRNEAVQTAFQEMLTNIVLGPELKKLGISVPDSEIADMMIGSHPAPEIIQAFTDPSTGQIAKQFQDPRTGGLNMAAVVYAVKKMNENELAGWSLREYLIRQRQLQSKYFDLVKYGINVTDAEAKQAFDDDNKYYTISYVLDRYATVPDNSVSVTDQDIQSYYNQHMYEFNQAEETRKIDYVSFFAAPTQKDLSDIDRQVDSITKLFKNLKPGDDSAFIVGVSDNHLFDKNYHKHGTLNPSIDSIMCNSEKGTIYGPYKENNEYRIAKLLDVADMPDSVKVAHIIIAADKNGDYTNAKKRIDSLKAIATPDNFADLAKKFSMDQQSGQKGGDLGWFTEGKLLPEMDKACFFANKGDIVEVKSQYGYHLMYIEDESTKDKFVKVGVIIKNIGPSTATLDDVYAQASSFSGKNPTGDAFEKAAADMNKRVSELKENEQTVPGIPSPKDLVRWAFTAKSGDVSGVFDIGENKYVVAHLMQITPQGTTPLALVKEAIRPKALLEKKAAKLIADMKSASQGAGSLEAVGQKLNIQVAKAQRLVFQTYTIPGLGKEDAVIGTMAGLKPQTLSQPIQGLLGVYVIRVDSVSTPAGGDFKFAQGQAQDILRNRVQYDGFDALEKKAGLVNHLGKFF
jgi:peptidyl-prolyl cis-trans isomerase D